VIGTVFGDTLTGDDGANLLDGGQGDDRLYGGQGSDTLVGGSGNDVLMGGLSIDAMYGGVGDDIYSVDSPTDVVREDYGQGTDQVDSSVSYTLGDNLENLSLQGTDAIDGNGNKLNNLMFGNVADNTLRGGDGNDTLDGRDGADTLEGGAGNDTYVVDSAGDRVDDGYMAGTDQVNAWITYTLGYDIENLTLLGTASINAYGNGSNNVITGNGGNNSLSGYGGNDQLYGDAGNDMLDGGSGNDSMWGGIGNDTYVVNVTGDSVFESDGIGQGVDIVLSSVTYILGANVENLTLVGTAGLSGTGNDLNNRIYGNSGDNVLNGLGGNDLIYGGAGNDALNGGDGDDVLDGGSGTNTLTGGAGNDTYAVRSLYDSVIEGVGAGTDQVNATMTYTLGTNVENLALFGTDNIDGFGNGLQNVMIGNSGNNAMSGGGGNDLLTGNAGNDVLFGGSGDDTAFGGTGDDTLTGGDGADSFVFERKGGVDHITDFTAGRDHIQIAATLWTLLGSKAPTSDAFYAAAGAMGGHDADDRLIYNTTTGALYYDTDGNKIGGAAAVQIAVLDQVGGLVPVLGYTDFIFS
jgi:Ca2+-binding RTX toxin-like protein